jgi:beta-galactosidase
MTHHRIFGTDEDLLFQASVDGIRELRFDVPDGTYDVELRFAETQGRQPGERVFDVDVNGEPVYAALDLAATAGPYAAVTKSARAECRRGAGLRVTFRSVHGEATVSAVKVTRR